uniref:Uncharacterized protein n=1 Tax=Panagrolaimus sp. PS1159 TaxID=55785 RepID=A0AC35GQA9_9BILA
SRDSAYGSTNKTSNRNTEGNTNRGSNRSTEGKRRTSQTPSERNQKPDKDDAQNDIIWPVPSFEYFAPTSKKPLNEHRIITPKGRFVIVDANTFYFDALQNGYVKYIFEVILRDKKQEIKVYVPTNKKQILPKLEDDLIQSKESRGTIRNANRLEEYTSFYMAIVKVIKNFYGRNAKIAYAYVNGIPKYNAKLMYNDNFRFIFSTNKIFAQEPGTSENDFHSALKSSNAKLTDDEKDLFIKTRKLLLAYDRINVELEGTGFYKPYNMHKKAL